MDKTEQMIDMWLDGVVLYTDLPDEVKKQVDAMIEEPLVKEDPTSSDVHVDGVDWKTPAKKKPKKKPMTEEEPMPLVHKSQNEHMFTMGPWYIPNKADAHNEWTDADELQKALWDYVRSGDRNIRLQHNRDIVAGEWLEAMSFPIPITMKMNKSDGSQGEVTYPEGTVFLGVQWKPWAWDMVKSGKITGFSIGGAAARVEMGLPVDMEKRSFGGDRSQAGRYAAQHRWSMSSGVLTHTAQVGNKTEHFTIKEGKASDIKSGDLVSTSRDSDPVKIVGTMTPDAKRGLRGKLSFIIQHLRSQTSGTMNFDKDQKVHFWNKVTGGRPAGGEKWRHTPTTVSHLDISTGRSTTRVLIPAASPTAKAVEFTVVPIDKVVGKSQVRNVAGLYGPNGEVGMVRTDGERYWAFGHSMLENLDHAIAQELFKQVDLDVEKAKKGTSFGGDRSQAGRYAANVRWGKKMREASGVPDGSAPLAKTAAGAALGYSKTGAPSLVTHCDLDAVAADMQAAGLKEPTADMYYKHLTPERRAEWDAAIAEKVNPVPVNPNGPNAYMMGGGGASGKSSAIKDKAVNVPNADPSEGPVKAVDVNPDSAKTQMASYNNMVAKKDTRAASFAHEESSQIAALTGAAGLKKGADIVVDGVADNGAAKTIGKTDTYRALGAKRVELHVVTVEIPTARARNVARAKKTGRLVDDGALVHGHKGVSKNFPEYAKSGKWDVVTVTDTNGAGARKIFEQRAGGRPKVIDQGLFDQFLAKADYKG